jgi:hypothetical protein
MNAARNPTSDTMKAYAAVAPYWTDTVGAALAIIVVVLLALRISKGVDLSDESYYAIFVDDWLKGDIATSSLVTLHQTAALIVYPLCRAFRAILGSSDGMFLFLRVLFLLGACLSACVSGLFFRKMAGPLAAWAGALLLLAFVPFGLPAPSYNSLGQQALTLALASLGCGWFSTGGTQIWWLFASAVAWALATVAYPTLAAVLLAQCAAALIYRDSGFPHPYLYVAIASACTGIATALVVTTLSFSRLEDSFTYLFAINDVGGIGSKLLASAQMLAANKLFAALCCSSALLGLLRNRVGSVATAVGITAVLACQFLVPPALLVRSHDTITLLALSEFGLLTGLRTITNNDERALSLIYATSLFAGLITMATATNSIMNFCIGAAPAAALALVKLIGRPASPIILSPAIVAVAGVLSTSLFFYYGDPSEQPFTSREPITDGFFAGLSVSVEDAALLRLMQDEVAPQLGLKPKIAIFGRLPGLVLTTSGRFSMPSPFPLVPTVSGDALAATHRFYEATENRPDWTLIIRQEHFALINPMQPEFEQWFVPAGQFKTAQWELSLYKRR